jgi:hypothetical protein
MHVQGSGDAECELVGLNQLIEDGRAVGKVCS